MPDKPKFDNLTDSQKMLMLSLSVNEMHNQLDRIRRDMYEGEGDILPVMERVRNLEGYARTTKFWFRTVAVAIVLQTITFGGAAIVYFMRLYPLLERLVNNPNF